MTNDVNEGIGFHYLLKKIQPYFFRIEHIPQDVLNKIKDKSIIKNIFRI